MSRLKRAFSNIGKYLVFGLLMGVGGAIISTFIGAAILHNWTWMFGKPTEGSTYEAIVQLLGWALWGYVGPVVAVLGYPMIFKKDPPRWMGIISIAEGGFVWILTVLSIGAGVALGAEFDLDAWKDFAHASTAIATLWYAFRLPPFARDEYGIAAYQS